MEPELSGGPEKAHRRQAMTQTNEVAAELTTSTSVVGPSSHPEMPAN